MSRKQAQYSHRDKFSSYMAVALGMIADAKPDQTALDVPAGAGHMGEGLSKKSYRVTNADFNDDHEDFVFADFNETLPFDDATFDVVTCLEGMEHVLDPFHLVGQLARVTKPGGTVVISTPNILNMFSRFIFLFTGTFYHFEPYAVPDVKPLEAKDRGHISPVSYHRLQYIANYHGLTVTEVKTDRYKKKGLMLMSPLIHTVGRLWGRKRMLRFTSQNDPVPLRKTYEYSFSNALLFGRTMVVSFQKKQA